jgi:PPE-repeat protein
VPGSSMAAGMGQATSLGPLSVPPAWTATAPSAASPVTPAPGSTLLATPPEVAGVPGVAPTGASLGARAGASAGMVDNRFLVRPPMVPSWAAVG